MHDELSGDISLEPEYHVQERNDYQTSANADEPRQETRRGAAKDIEEKDSHERAEKFWLSLRSEIPSPKMSADLRRLRGWSALRNAGAGA
jgi:hypothetical protein